MKYELPSTELIVIEENNYLKFGEYLNDMQCDDTANKLNLDDLEHVKKLQQENQQLKHILDELEKYLNKNMTHYVNDLDGGGNYFRYDEAKGVLDKIKELRGRENDDYE